MEILHDHQFLYMVHAIGKKNNFVSLVLKNHVLLKKKYFLKNKTFKKCHLLNKQNQQSVQILYNGTFYILCMKLVKGRA